MTIIYDFYAQPMISLYIETAAMFVIWTAAMLLLRGKTRRTVALTVTVISIALIFVTTIYGRSDKTVDTVPDFLPLISFVYSDYKTELWRSMFLNIMLFMPLGLSMPFVPGKRVKHIVLVTILSGLGLSVLIELVQLAFLIGKFEINDMIMNTIGTALGTVSFILVSRIRRKTNKRVE